MYKRQAQWKYTGSSDGGNSGGGNTPNPDRPYVPGGPGETVTVEPGDVPLANLPESGPADNLILIDDGNVPLAGLPKTGDRTGAHAGLAALLSGFLLAAFTAVSYTHLDVYKRQRNQHDRICKMDTKF